jgi:hypothetical protein
LISTLFVPGGFLDRLSLATLGLPLGAFGIDAQRVFCSASDKRSSSGGGELVEGVDRLTEVLYPQDAIFAAELIRSSLRAVRIVAPLTVYN